MHPALDSEEEMEVDSGAPQTASHRLSVYDFEDEPGINKSLI